MAICSADVVEHLEEEGLVDFDYKCPKCGEDGSGVLKKPFTFCPDCGGKLEVKVNG